RAKGGFSAQPSSASGRTSSALCARPAIHHHRGGQPSAVRPARPRAAACLETPPASPAPCTWNINRIVGSTTSCSRFTNSWYQKNSGLWPFPRRTPMTQPAALYARVSSDRQKENHTIDSQTAALIQFAQTHDYHLPAP